MRFIELFKPITVKDNHNFDPVTRKLVPMLPTTPKSNAVRNSSLNLKRVVSAKEFVRIVKANRNAIEHSRFVPPKLGSSGFGRFVVSFRKIHFD